MTTPDDYTPTREEIVAAELTAVALVEATVRGDQGAMVQLTAGSGTQAAQLAVSVASLAATMTALASHESGRPVAALLDGARRYVLDRETGTPTLGGAA